jgi:hypothetical protein
VDADFANGAAMDNPTIKIGSYESICLNCNGFADFHEVSHIRVPGDVEAVGCGIRWTNMISAYNGSSMQNIVKLLRPDLILQTGPTA